MSAIEADILVLGAGTAALVTALSVRNRHVTILTPELDDQSQAASDLAQGGMAAAVAPDDSPALHLADTLEAGGDSVERDVARYLCEHAPAAVDYLRELGVPFDRMDGAWSLHTEAAHSRARVLHVGDATGAAIMRTLRQAAKRAPHIRMRTGMRAVQLLTSSEGVHGVVAAQEDGRNVLVHAREVIIATGGVGGLYSRTTNPLTACGDGLAIALAAGARCAGLEFVQFHPTALDKSAPRLPLITEALRGAGAKLVDECGERILQGIHPLAELAPRDVVARAVYLAQQRGARVNLDATHLDLNLASTFPSVYAMCMEQGFDLHREPIPITPAAHYYMGGIEVDPDGRSTLPGLWAVGEAACTGVHGSNRLASNSLLEAVVFGRRCGRALSNSLLRGAAPYKLACAHTPIASGSVASREVREMMWRCMGVVRSAATISEGLSYVARLRERTSPSLVFDHSRLVLIERMLMAAARHTTNCGAHYRSDARGTRTERRAAGVRKEGADAALA